MILSYDYLLQYQINQIVKMHSSKAVTSFFFWLKTIDMSLTFLRKKTRYKNSQLIIFVPFREIIWNIKEQLGIYFMKIMNLLWSSSERRIEKKKIHVIQHCFSSIKFSIFHDSPIRRRQCRYRIVYHVDASLYSCMKIIFTKVSYYDLEISTESVIWWPSNDYPLYVSNVFSGWELQRIPENWKYQSTSTCMHQVIMKIKFLNWIEVDPWKRSDVSRNENIASRLRTYIYLINVKKKILVIKSETKSYSIEAPC